MAGPRGSGGAFGQSLEMRTTRGSGRVGAVFLVLFVTLGYAPFLPLAEAAEGRDLAPVSAPLPVTRAAPAVQPPSDDGVLPAYPLSVETGLHAPVGAPPPNRRPAGLATRPVAASAAPPVPGGGLCSDPRLEGAVLPEIVSASGVCRVPVPVRLAKIAGIRLSSPAVLTCATAKRFADWTTGTAAPAATRHLGARIVELEVMASYACRTRNHRKGARISEHGFGRAVDIGGVTLSDGRRIRLATDWGKGDGGRFLREVREKACGTFSTVLGPGSDAFHDNHFHFDTAQRKSGRTWCR